MSKSRTKRGAVWLPVVAAVAIAMAGCASTKPPPMPESSPVAQGGLPAAAGGASSPTSGAAPSPQPVNVRYVVRRGDTLTRIARAHGCTIDDLRAWNRLGQRSRLTVGQVLRIVTHPAPPAAGALATGTTGAATGGGAAMGAQAASENADRPTRAEDETILKATKRHAKRVALIWPALGPVVVPFEPGTNRGIQIAGRPGEPVRAAASGRVMYAGTGLNDYGTLILIQHNADFLTAYSHNRKLLVKTGDIVQQGEPIAEMGAVDNVRVAVSFEVRRDGMPVDPLPYLPSARQG